MPNSSSNLQLKQTTNLIRLALREDLGRGDITSKLCVPPKTAGLARIVAKQNLIICGLDLIGQIFLVYSPALGRNIKLKRLARDGQVIKPGQVVAEIQARLVDLLALERTILNFLQRLSGISTMTHSLTSKHPDLEILDTRKTTPGWRSLEKYAVRTGGGENHRFGLWDMILVKNNHIDANNGSVEATLTKIYSRPLKGLKVEVEVRNHAELKSALQFKPDIVMLDNFTDAQIPRALEMARKLSPRTLVEVSGGLKPARLSRLTKMGVKRISMGALTHSARAADISMRIGLR